MCCSIIRIEKILHILYYKPEQNDLHTVLPFELWSSHCWDAVTKSKDLSTKYRQFSWWSSSVQLLLTRDGTADMCSLQSINKLEKSV